MDPLFSFNSTCVPRFLSALFDQLLWPDTASEHIYWRNIVCYNFSSCWSRPIRPFDWKRAGIVQLKDCHLRWHQLHISLMLILPHKYRPTCNQLRWGWRSGGWSRGILKSGWSTGNCLRSCRTEWGALSSTNGLPPEVSMKNQFWKLCLLICAEILNVTSAWTLFAG